MELITRQVKDKPLTVTIEYPNLDSGTKNLIQKVKALDLSVIGSREGKTFSVNLSDLYYIEAVDRKTFLYTKNDVYLTDKKLYELEELFRDTMLIRISKSCMMNMDMLYSIRQLMNSQLEATLINDEKLIVGRTYLKKIKSILRKEEKE